MSAFQVFVFLRVFCGYLPRFLGLRFQFEMQTKPIVRLVVIIALIASNVAALFGQGPGEDSRADDKVNACAEYPSFSWDRIPLYMHIRKKKSFTDEEIAFLSRFPLITFEKANGHEDHGSVEEGTLAAARAVKKVNSGTKILFYRNVIAHYDAYAANKTLATIPNAFLTDEEGRTGLIRGRIPAYDLSNPRLRQWWVESCRRVLADPAIDGVLLDGNIKALEPGYLAKHIGSEKKTKTTEGYHLMMRQTRQAIGPGKLMVANILRARFPQAGLE
jgi:hypothetical protein